MFPLARASHFGEPVWKEPQPGEICGLVPFWGRCTTHFSLLLSGLGCSLGIRDFDPWPHVNGSPGEVCGLVHHLDDVQHRVLARLHPQLLHSAHEAAEPSAGKHRFGWILSTGS